MKHFLYRALASCLALTLLLLITPSVRAQQREEFHAAYLCGYPDGTIRPDEPLTREALAQALLRLMDASYLEGLGRVEGCFLDVAPSRWSYRAISTLAKPGFVLADPDGRFRPTDGVTGQELALTLARIAGSEAGQVAFSDLSSGWSALAITFADGNGWVMGLHDGVFSPDAPLTRAQFAGIINRILGRTPESLSDLLVGMPVFSDNADTGTPYFLDLQEAATGHSYEKRGGAERWTALG